MVEVADASGCPLDAAMSASYRRQSGGHAGYLARKRNVELLARRLLQGLVDLRTRRRRRDRLLAGGVDRRGRFWDVGHLVYPSLRIL